MVERSPTSVVQSLLLLIAVLIGVFIGAVIGYLFGQARPRGEEIILTATAEACRLSLAVTPTQIMVTADRNETPIITESTAITPINTALLTPVSPTHQVAPTTLPEPTSTSMSTNTEPIPLPEVISSTPTVQMERSIEISETQANEIAKHSVATTPELGFLSDPSIQFLDGKIDLRAQSNDLTGQLGKGELVVHGHPEIIGIRVVFKIENAQIADRPVPKEFHPNIEAIVNSVFREIIGERPSKEVEVKPSIMRVKVLETR